MSLLFLFLAISIAADRTPTPPLEIMNHPHFRFVITPQDPTALVSVQYADTGEKYVWDTRRGEGWEGYAMIDMHQFIARFSDGLLTEILCNVELGDVPTVQPLARKYARYAGQMPTYLRRNLHTIIVHGGDEIMRANRTAIWIHQGAAHQYERGQTMEEAFYHEGAHNSLEREVRADPRWKAAQDADGIAITEYAATGEAEDVAESYVAWVAVRFRRARITRDALQTILSTIPNRLRYFDQYLGAPE